MFGRESIVEEILGLVQGNTLGGGGGSGKTFIALTGPHHKHAKRRYNNERGFIRCDEFPTSVVHFLIRLSKVENPTDLPPLRPLLSSEQILITLEDAEPIIDPKASDVRAIYNVVDKLGRLSNVSLFITSANLHDPTEL